MKRKVVEVDFFLQNAKRQIQTFLFDYFGWNRNICNRESTYYLNENVTVGRFGGSKEKIKSKKFEKSREEKNRICINMIDNNCHLTKADESIFLIDGILLFESSKVYRLVYTIYARKEKDQIIICGLSYDIEENAETLRITADQDSLTKLWNRAATEKKIDEYLSDGENCGTIFMIDIDYFKKVNDTKGHMEGDRILMAAANMLRKKLPCDSIIGRMGGDEFLAFLKGKWEKYIIEEMAEEILNSFHVLQYEEKILTGITASIGIAVAEKKNVEDFLALWEKADKALYTVKMHGKNGYYLYRTNSELERQLK